MTKRVRDGQRWTSALSDSPRKQPVSSRVEVDWQHRTPFAAIQDAQKVCILEPSHPTISDMLLPAPQPGLPATQPSPVRTRLQPNPAGKWRRVTRKVGRQIDNSSCVWMTHCVVT